MIRFTPQPEELRRYCVGPLGPHVESFAALISEKGYCLQVGQRMIGRVADFSRWLERRHVTLTHLKEAHIDVYLKMRWKNFSFRDGDQLTMTSLLRYLRQSHVIPTPNPQPPNEVDLVMQDYKHFLIEHRALVRGSVELYLPIARRFTRHYFESGQVRFKRLQPKDVVAFVLRDTANRSGSVAQLITTVVRSFLGFLFQRKQITTNLVLAVPTVARWPLSRPPRFLEAEQVEKILRSCDRRTKNGKRDYAILLLLARLGLRACEVANLNLEDINWRDGELLIHGKGGALDKLPLPQDVGEALIAYLRMARPDCSSRSMFLRCFAPYGGVSNTTVGYVVRRAINRARIQSAHNGAHVLRHSLATRMLGHGASLAQIGQVLRHQYVGSTEIYAKVDLNALRRLALPWPGGSK